MKKVMILLGFMLLLDTSILAQETENYVVIEEPTNVRSAPLTGYYQPKPIVRAVVSNVRLPVIGRNFDDDSLCGRGYYHNNNMWFQVEVDGVEGWVRVCNNDFVGDLLTVPQAQPINAEYRLCAKASRLHDEFGEVPIQDELGEAPTQSHVVAQTNAYRINVRKLPDIGAERIELLTSDEVYIIGRSADNIWFKVTYNAMVATCGYRNYWERQQFTGWVAGFLLDLPDNWHDIIPVIES